MRISIIGHAASGKSTLASTISKKLNVPCLHIDKLWFEADGHRLRPDDIQGKEAARAHIKSNVESFIQQDAWVSDGWYPRAQLLIAKRADQILFLDISLFRRLLNHIRRVFIDQRHKEITWWDELKFIYTLIRRTYSQGPRMNEFVRGHASKIIILRNYKEVRRYLISLY